MSVRFSVFALYRSDFYFYSEGGFFKCNLIFPKEYPNKPPKLKFVTEIWHPNSELFSDLSPLFSNFFFFDLAVVTLSLKILSKLYLGNRKVEEVDSWYGQWLGGVVVQRCGVPLIWPLTLL